LIEVADFYAANVLENDVSTSLYIISWSQFMCVGRVVIGGVLMNTCQLGLILIIIIKK